MEMLQPWWKKSDDLTELPPVVLASKEPELECDEFLDSIIAEDLEMDNHSIEE